MHVLATAIAIAFASFVAAFVFVVGLADCDRETPLQLGDYLFGASLAAVSSIGFFLTAFATLRVAYLAMAIRVVSAVYWLGLCALGVLALSSYWGFLALQLGCAMLYYLAWITYRQRNPAAS